MSDRTSFPVDRDVFEALKAQKGEFETWSEYLLALTELAEEYHDPPTLDD